MRAIHKAVIDSGGTDDYTGQDLAWENISKYDNAQSKAGRQKYKATFSNLPTVDHYGDDLTANSFKICSWRTNDCKNDLSYEQLIDFCQAILAHHESKTGQRGRE